MYNGYKASVNNKDYPHNSTMNGYADKKILNVGDFVDFEVDYDSSTFVSIYDGANNVHLYVYDNCDMGGTDRGYITEVESSRGEGTKKKPYYLKLKVIQVL